MLKKILIANRGEIALRVIRTCRELGIETVAVYSEADRDSLAVRFATEAIAIGGPSPAESYLDFEKVLQAARDSGADGIHPGYGFLAENAEFVRACEKEGIAFIGPPVRAMQVMGDKLESRRAMQEAGVPIVPGTAQPLADVEEALATAREIGFPVMLKASAGGGGKGIRAVHEESELASAFLTASGEAESAFGDGRMYVEKLIERPRHIEVQILADHAGATYAIGTRECSIQRRHQKVIEEAPAVGLAEGVEEAMLQAAVDAAKAVDYFSAGTVEFLYSNGEFYFLEMNTRLQVEHPVTEEVFGIDLVEWMIRVASGESLPDLSQLQARGHAIEVRVNAEDPANNFMPSLGRIHGLRIPSGPGIRVDAATFHGMEVTPYYDAMIAKLIASGKDRDHARRRAIRMLQEFYLGGVATNTGLAMRVLQCAEFADAAIDTGFLERFLEEGRAAASSSIAPGLESEDAQVLAAIIGALARHHEGATVRQSAQTNDSGMSPWMLVHRQNTLRGGAR